MRRGLGISAVCVAAWMSGAAQGANPAFQDFFFRVCESASGELATRCGETPGAGGDLSGDSESSLNPSQTLASSDGALAAVRSRTKEARERVDRYRSGDDAPATGLQVGPFSLLVNGRLVWEERDRDPDADAERGYQADRQAIEIGFDRRFTDRLAAGLVYAYEEGELEFDAERPGVAFTPAADAGGIDQESHALTLFALFWLSEGGYLEMNAGYAASDYRFRRNAVFQESTRSLTQTNVRSRASTDGTQVWAGATAGYDWHAGATSFGIYGGGTYARSRIDGYRENDQSNSGLALVVDDQKRSAVTGHAGVRAQWAIPAGSGVWVPQMRMEYQYAGSIDESESRVHFALDEQQNAFALQGGGTDDHFNLALGIAGIFPNGWITFADVESLLGARDREQYRLTIGLRKEL